ncbi:ATP-dependent zinc protease family protein [Isoalcanivorax indicus]|uniref:ATP-dependent zinc protease family protein n=1 Tax=Isoalcanivorax indicus TaxID=2202653 RepID=UPI000DBA56A5|nr:RimK/LysX family protein [Isoalcanivorax indicus]
MTVLPVSAVAESEPVHKVILGLIEQAHVDELDLTVEAKLDTGAVSASLSAYDIEIFERNGDDWVRFRLGTEGDDAEQRELPLDHKVRIRRRLADIDDEAKTYTRRPVVRLMVCIGERQVPMRVNLTDRRNFSYALLIGAEGLTDLRSIIDPSQENSAGAPECGMTLGEAGEKD